jgi:hypothetical protein
MSRNVVSSASTAWAITPRALEGSKSVSVSDENPSHAQNATTVAFGMKHGLFSARTALRQQRNVIAPNLPSAILIHGSGAIRLTINAKVMVVANGNV